VTMLRAVGQRKTVLDRPDQQRDPGRDLPAEF